MPSCAQCHRDVPGGIRFCPYCGTALEPRPPARSEDPLIGRMVKGSYFVQQHLATGGMGRVYKALHTTLDSPVALKVLNRALLADGQVVQRFYREARSASRLRHPNVIAVTDFGEMEDGSLFMVMEFVAGRNLAAVIAEDFPISEPRVVRIGTQILAALAEAHAQGIIHRDLKPENVMIESRRDEPDSVKVLDFGIAKVRQAGEGATLTQHGLVCGTPGYMSPEQWEGEDLDPRSDLYAVGVILYQMLTGKLPFDARTPGAMHRQQLEGSPPPPSNLRDDHAVSKDLEAIVLRALSPGRDDRPASAEEMRNELLACAVLPATTSASVPAPPRTVVMAPASLPPSVRRLPPPAPEPLGPTTPDLAARTPGGLRARGAPVAATPARAAGRATPARNRRTTSSGERAMPRHELDEGDGDEELPQETPPPRPRRRGLLAGAIAVFLVAGAGAAALVPFGGSRLVDRVMGAWRAPEAPEPEKPALPAVSQLPEPSLPPRREPATPPRPEPSERTFDAPRPGSAGAEAGGATQGDRATLPAIVAGTPRRTAEEQPRPAGTGRAPGEQPQPLALDEPPGAAPSPAPAPATATDRRSRALPEEPRLAAIRRAPPHVARPRAPAPAPRPREVARAEPRRGEVLTVTDVLNALPTPPRDSGEGVISVQADPFGDVYLDGKRYGEAPREFRVSAGTYRVRATHPELGEREETIRVEAGARARWTAEFVK